MLEGVTVVYRSNVDLFFYVIGSQTENEVTINSVGEGYSNACCCIQKQKDSECGFFFCNMYPDQIARLSQSKHD